VEGHACHSPACTLPPQGLCMARYCYWMPGVEPASRAALPYPYQPKSASNEERSNGTDGGPCFLLVRGRVVREVVYFALAPLVIDCSCHE